MHVVGQDDPGVDLDGALGERLVDGMTERLDFAEERVGPARAKATVKNTVAPGRCGRR